MKCGYCAKALNWQNWPKHQSLRCLEELKMVKQNDIHVIVELIEHRLHVLYKPKGVKLIIKYRGFGIEDVYDAQDKITPSLKI